MAFATANPNEYLVVGWQGRVENRGSGIRVFLWPGSTYVLVPSTKQETAFEMTQETRDGIPLRFKGNVIYRIVDPVIAARSFNFKTRSGMEEINVLIREICLGELRAVVSGMTMQECIEQRKTVLTSVVGQALRQVISENGSLGTRWGIDVEMALVAQVYIVDNDLRKQLEAEIRNDIRAKSEQSNIHSQEIIRLAQIASDRQVQEQKVQTEKDALRQKEEMETAALLYRRRMQKQNQELAEEEVRLAVETFKVEQEAARQKTESEAPVQLLQVEKERQLMEQRLDLRRREAEVRALEVERDLLLERAHVALKKEILPLEQAPAIAASLAQIFKDADLTFIGEENQLLSAVLPLMGRLVEKVKVSLSDSGPASKADA